MYLKLVMLVILLLTARLPQAFAQAALAQTSSKQSPAKPQTYTREGISVEFGVAPISAGEKTAEPMADTESRVRFKILEVNGGKTLGNLRPAAWIDRRDSGQSADPRECREKIQSFLQPGFNKRPTIDLNVYFILALNHEPNISVIDPLSGFGGSKLYNLISLRGPGQDWVMSADQKRLYVSLPSVNEVAVIDIQTWKVIANLDAGIRPMRVALQHDGRYLWVGNDGPGEKGNGITVIDTVTLKVAAQINTGAGHHEIGFTADDSLAFVTNKQDGTLSAIDVRRLVRVTNTKVGLLPGAIAFSSLGQAVYVANEGDGTIAVLDDWGREIQARMKAQPGLGAVRMTPDGRFGLVVNKATSTIYVFDVAANRIIHAVPVGSGADQVTFTREFAYVRSAGNEFVTMIKLADLGKEAAVSRFPAGQKAPQESPAESLADAIVPAPESGAVLVANPADKMIYFYTEGMAAPMGSFQNYRRDPKALLVFDKSLRETAPGEYTTTVRFTEAGNYDVAFLLDSPRVVNCFTVTVAENPGLPKPARVAIRVDPVLKQTTAVVGESYNLRLKVTDTNSQQPKSNIEDLGVLVFLAPGIWQQRQWARHVGEGLYEISFVPPQPGVYYVYFQCPSLGVQFNQIIPLTLEATKK